MKLTKAKPGETVAWGTSTYTVLVSAAMTGGRLSIYESVNAPGAGPPRHIQGDDEAIYILDGEIEVWMSGKTERRGKGELVFVPRGVEHTFKTVSATPSRFLVISAPGGFEGFFAAVAARNLRIPEDLPAIEEVAAHFNLRHTGPPL